MQKINRFVVYNASSHFQDASSMSVAHADDEFIRDHDNKQQTTPFID